LCTNCGKPIKETQKFCGSCGTAVESASPSGITPPSPSTQEAQIKSAQGEAIRAILPNLVVSKSFGRSDTFNLIVTDQRSVFAKLTSQIMNETVKMRREKAAAEGKGFFGKWAVQMSGFNTYTDRYQTMRPEEALLENKENFQIENSMIKKVKSSSDDDEDRPMYDIEITTATQKLKFKTQYDPEHELKKAYG
jgi:nucleotidyltransferase/DNA polymerase involved in DNA repair